jgi:hypothetical protein
MAYGFGLMNDESSFQLNKIGWGGEATYWQ